MEAVTKKPGISKRKGTDDFSLIQLAIGGSEQAFTLLMERYRDSIHHTVQKMVHNKDDADDLTQEAFGKAFNSLSSYRPTYAFSTWLFRIAINNCIDHIRKKKLRTFSLDAPLEQNNEQNFTDTLRANYLNPEELAIREQRLAMMRRLVSQLSGRYQLMVEMRYFEGLSYDEISKELEVPIGTVKAQLHRAREILLEMVNKPEAAAYFEHRKRG